MGTIVHSGKELRDYVFTVGLVLTSMHYARRWSLAVINSMPIIPQASGKQYKPRSRESHNKKKTEAYNVTCVSQEPPVYRNSNISFL